MKSIRSNITFCRKTIKNVSLNYTATICVLFAILFCSQSIGFCQKISNDAFVLNGKINVNSGSINIDPVGDSSFYPKSFLKTRGVIKNGTFSLSGNIQYPQAFYLYYIDSTGQGRGLSDIIYLEKGKQNVSYKLETSGISELENSTMNEYQKEFKPRFNLIEEERKTLDNYYDSIRKIGNDSLLKIANRYYDAKLSTILHKSFCIYLDYVSKRPNSYPVLWSLIRQIPWGYETIYDSIYSKFSKEIKSTYAGLALKRWLDNGRITKIGNPFPFVLLSSIEGNTVRLNFKGYATYTLLDFWYSHCGPCIAQFPKLKKIYSTCHSKGFEIVGISVDKKEDVNDYGNAIKKYELIWKHYWDINKVQSNQLGIGVYPSNFLLDNTGKVIAKNISPDDLEVFLNKNLN